MDVCHLETPDATLQEPPQPVPFIPGRLTLLLRALNAAPVSAIIPAALEQTYDHYHD